MRELLQALLKTGGARVASIGLNILSIKIFASILGPYGVGLFSMVQQILRTTSALASFGGQTAIVQGVSNRKEDARVAFLTTALQVMAASLFLTACLMIILAPWIARCLFHTPDPIFTRLIRWLSLPLIFTVAMAYLNSLLNGLRAIGRMALAQIISAGVLTLLAYPCALSVSKSSALAFVFALSFSLGAGALASFLFCFKAGWIKRIAVGFRSSLRLSDFKAFLSFAGVMLSLDIISTSALLLIRSLVIQHGGLETAGIFGAAWSVSMQYVTLMLGSFSAYYLPSLTRLGGNSERAKLIENMALLSIIIMIPLTATVIAAKPLIINLLYTNDFLPSLKIMRWMLIGDYLRTTGWCFGMTLIAFARVRIFMLKEATLHLLNLGFVYYALMFRSDIEWIGIGVLIVNGINLAFLLLLVARAYRFARPKLLIGGWLSGLGILLTASWLTWNDQGIIWSKTLSIIMVAVIHALFLVYRIRPSANEE